MVVLAVCSKTKEAPTWPLSPKQDLFAKFDPISQYSPILNLLAARKAPGLNSTMTSLARWLTLTRTVGRVRLLNGSASKAYAAQLE
ncbi:hypothetical protein BH24ACI3_BH24ACI3_16340 [soil metagenome]